MHKYKADQEKYTIESRSISCRNAWCLETYDINEAGQVHTYIGYLARLPYEEQIYWQSFNEWPKASISKRAYQTDFEGIPSTLPDPVEELKRHARELDEQRPYWWLTRGAAVISAVHAPASDAQAEWASEVMALDQMLVEGLSVKGIRNRLAAVGVAFEKEWGSIRLLEALLKASGVEADKAADIVEPLKTLHFLRSKLKGHAAIRERRELESNARKKFENLRGHFINLASECNSSIRYVRAILIR